MLCTLCAFVQEPMTNKTISLPNEYIRVSVFSLIVVVKIDLNVRSARWSKSATRGSNHTMFIFLVKVH